MNYNPFLNKNYMSKNQNRYTLSNTRKNGRIFLLSSILSIVVLCTLVIVLTDSNVSIVSRQADTFKAAPTARQQTTTLDLPEIGYHSQVLSAAVRQKPTADNKPQNSIDANSINTVTSDVAHESEVALELVINTRETAQLSEETSQPDHFAELAEVTTSSAIKSTIVNETVNETANETVNKKVTASILEKVTAPQITAADTSHEVQLTASSNSVPDKATHSKTVVVKKGDTLSAIFKRLSLSSSTLYKIINSDKQAKRLTRIKPGQKFIITVDNNNQFQSLNYAFDQVESLVITKKDQQFVARIDSKEIELQQQFAAGIINNSLFSAGSKAGLSSSMTMELAHIFGWDIDFALDIRKGDSFAVLFEEQTIDGKKIGRGNILSAEFVNKGKVFKAIRYTDSSGHTDYYSEKGLSMRKAFLRTPVDFSRISSRFSSGRKHPVLNRIRAHKGVDYAASRGTPIKAVGKGKVIFKGTKGGYGRVIILQHGSKYTTLYAHMKSYNKKIKHGKRVTQGQIIGYVGSSGLATGPHLHYEFRVNGVHRNPLTVPLPSAAPIAKKYRSDFRSTADTLISQLKLRKQETIAFKDI